MGKIAVQAESTALTSMYILFYSSWNEIVIIVFHQWTISSVCNKRAMNIYVQADMSQNNIWCNKIHDHLRPQGGILIPDGLDLWLHFISRRMEWQLKPAFLVSDVCEPDTILYSYL